MNIVNKFIVFIALLMCFTIATDAAVDEQEVKEKLSLLMGQNNSGTDYWFTVPPPFLAESGGYENDVKILVASPINTKVQISIPGKSFSVEYDVPENEVIDISIPIEVAQPVAYNGATQYGLPAKVYKGAGIHLTSSSPVVVYVISKAKYTTDGFLAIPSSSLGSHYINMAYQEPNITGGYMTPFTGVTGVYDNTDINLTMGGGPEGNDEILFENGQKLHTGESTSQNLDHGDVWLLSINGHQQDLSGSIFSGNKPFAIVSGMHCANFPLGVYYCDYSVEMELPVHTWGKQYFVTPMADRTYNGLVRIFASEDNTTIYRDKEEIATLTKGGGGTINEAYFEMRLWPKEDKDGNINPPKIATIHADKPISVMYYNTGVQEDMASSDNDPFMMLFTPVEQFGNKIYFGTPNSKTMPNKFVNNYANLVFELDNGEFPDDLYFAELSKPNYTWQKLSDRFTPQFKPFAVPFNGKDYGAKTIKLPVEGVYGIQSKTTKFAAYSFGNSPYESYGYPTAPILSDIIIDDFVAPLITTSNEKDNDFISGSLDDTEGNSSGLSQFYMIGDLSKNYKFEILSVDNGEATNSENEKIFLPGITRKLDWTLTKINPDEEGYAVLYISDRSGNDKLEFFGNTLNATTVKSEKTLSEYMLLTQQSIEILPNAIADGFTELEIFDMNGSKVATADITAERNISLNSLLSGSYVITLKSDERLLTRKMNMVR